MRISATKNISKITVSMKMVSASKLRGDQVRLEAARPYNVSATLTFCALDCVDGCSGMCCAMYCVPLAIVHLSFSCVLGSNSIVLKFRFNCSNLYSLYMNVLGDFVCRNGLKPLQEKKPLWNQS